MHSGFKIKILYLVFSLVLIINNLVSGAEQTGQTKSILVLFARVPISPAYKFILDGIRTELSQKYGDRINLYSEYLEIERYPEGGYPEEKFDVFNRKYETVPLDLLICVGIDVIPVIRQYASDFLLRLPSVSLDFDFTGYGYRSDLALNDLTAVIGLKIDAEKTISVALNLFPETRQVYFVCGNSATDQILYSLSKIASENMKGNRNAVFIRNVSMDEAIAIVRNLPDSSIIIMPSFYMDGKQVPFNTAEASRLLSMAANAPLFTYTTSGFGDGAVGGYMISFTKAGRITGEAAVKILDGTPAHSISYSREDYYEYAFDWRQLSRWNVSRSEQIPEGSRISFRENDIFMRYRWYILSGIGFLLLQTILIFLLILLIKKQRLMTRQLQESDNKFRELIREDRILRIGQLTATLSHELNQPLTAILSTAQAGLRFIDSKNPDPELMREILQNIVEDDKRTAAILSSIRGMMKLEKREKEKVNLNSLIKETVVVFWSEAVANNLKLDQRLTDEPVHIFADPVQIQQVMLNLVTNAAQSMVRMPSDRKVILITEKRENESVIVTVRDHGPGIDEAFKDKIFMPFVTSRAEGSGIGLAICQSIIHNHEGKIWAENRPEGGAEFAFSLKIYKDE